MSRREPDPAANERDTLEQFLDYHRATLLAKTDGLSAEQLRRPLPTSALTLAGLLKHLALVEHSWIHQRFLGAEPGEPWASAPFDDDPDWDFHSAVLDDPDYLRALYRDTCDQSRAAVTGRDLDERSVEAPRDGRPRSLRWVFVHLIEETARHNGHVDLLREAIDGSIGE